ncbi:MAG: DMT family transporter [Candidatus Binatia bacterium]
MAHGAAPVLFALASALLFAAATPASKVLLAELSAFQLAGLLYLGAALAMLPVIARRPHVRSTQLDPANRCRLLGAVAAGGLVAPVLLLAALRLTPAASVSLLLNLELAATAVLGALVFHEPLGRTGWLGAAGIAIAGGVLSGGDWPGLAAAALVAAACVSWALDNHFTALIDGITPALSIWWKGLAAGGTNLAIGLALQPLSAPAGEVVAALMVGALSYGVSIVLYINAAHRLGAVRAQAVFSSAPFLGAALGVALLGEPLPPAMLFAIAVLVPSVALVLRSAHAHLHTHIAVEHVHSHRHDDGHHDHVHEGLAPSVLHSHRHSHPGLAHAHPHWPDLHHRHEH